MCIRDRDYAFLQILQYPICHHLVAVNEGISAAYAVVSVGIIKRIKLLSCFDEGVDKINGVPVSYTHLLLLELLLLY